MADSNITKRALSQALKELMETESFQKISVGEICEKCEMNRKSFYYHFKDKYDLVNWIYYTEFLSAAGQKEYESSWDMLLDLCEYFYKNKSFYHKTLSLEGQNSFSEYFREVLASVITDALDGRLTADESIDFTVDFYSDALVCAVRRWLSRKECQSPEEFVSLLKITFKAI